MKLASKEIKPWLEKETNSVFVPVHTKAQKMVDEMKESLEELSGVCKALSENSAKEIEKRNMKTYRRARALNKLARLFTERIQRIKVPDKVSYDACKDLVEETQKAMAVTEVDIRNWFPRISPFFIIDRRRFQISFEKAKEVLKELNTFLTKEYIRTKTLEETYQLTDKLVDLEKQLQNHKEQREKCNNERAVIERQITEAKRSIEEMKSKGSLGQLGRIDSEIDALTTELRLNLQHLQKPFIKLQSLAQRGGGSGLMHEESTKLSQYLENPFEALATEEPGYPLLNSILEKLNQSMIEKLNLKPEKERKAKQVIESILREKSLLSLQQRCSEAYARKKSLSTSAETAGSQASLHKLTEQLESCEHRKRIVESELSVAERNYSETLERIRTTKTAVEKNTLDFLEKTIRIE